MKPQELFKVIVATAGLLTAAYGAVYLIDGMLFSIGLMDLQRTRPGFYAARGVIQLAIGVALMRGASGIVEIAFPSSRDGSVEASGQRQGSTMGEA